MQNNVWNMVFNTYFNCAIMTSAWRIDDLQGGKYAAVAIKIVLCQWMRVNQPFSRDREILLIYSLIRFAPAQR